MPNSVKKTQPILNEKGREICGAKLRNKAKKGKICNRSPIRPLGRCSLHGGKSTGPKNSLEYYRKTVLEDDQESLDIVNPNDLEGEIGLVRSLLSHMMDDPLRAYCFDCKQWVQVDIECPNKEYDNDKRAENGKRPNEHHVKVRDNNHSDAVKATKLLSDIVKNHKEIQKGKEITIRVEILNIVITRVVEAYEKANHLTDPTQRRRVFVEAVDRLLLDTAQGEVAERVSRSAN